MRGTRAGTHQGDSVARGSTARGDERDASERRAAHGNGALRASPVGRALAEYAAGEGAADDPEYPSASPPDLLHSARTLTPLLPAFDGVAMPFVWSRLHPALDGALDELWGTLGLLDWMHPRPWVTLAFGRMAIHAHGWQRLVARATGAPLDLSATGPPMGSVASFRERWRASRRSGGLGRRIERARAHAEQRLGALSAGSIVGQDTATLARGPLEARDWLEATVAWLGARVCDPSGAADPTLLLQAVRAEQRFAGEVGRRLTQEGVLREPRDVIYLSAVERLRAVHDAGPPWAKLVARRARRIAMYLELDVPELFVGRPRLDAPPTRTDDGPAPHDHAPPAS